MRGDTFVYQVFEGGAERDRIVDFNTGADDYSDDYTDHLYFGTTFQEKAGLRVLKTFWITRQKMKPASMSILQMADITNMASRSTM